MSREVKRKQNHFCLVLMPTLARRPNNKKKSNNMGDNKRESARQAQRRLSEHKPKCNMAKAMKRCDRSVSQPTKKIRARLKKKRPMPKQNPAQGESKIQRIKTQ